MSNGTPVITFSNPKTFKVIRRIQVRDGKMPVKYLNELEFIRGEIWANVFTTDVIARISPHRKVLDWIDLILCRICFLHQEKKRRFKRNRLRPGR